MEFLKLVLLLTMADQCVSWRVASYWPSKQVVENELSKQLTGRVLRPGDRDYYKYSIMMNTDFNKNPGAIAVVKNKEDIRKCILFARKYHLRVTVRSSGHSYVGRSTADGSLQINVSQMKNITVQPRDTTSDTGASAVVESGNIWRDVYVEVDKHNLLAVGGSAHTVSIGGYTIGGGHSPMTRMLGLGVDSVMQFTMVTAQGDYVTASLSSETLTGIIIEKIDGSRETRNDRDLFWAVRGGGLAYGVITEYKIKLHPAPPKEDGVAFVNLLLYASIDHPILEVGNAAKKVLDFWGKFIADDKLSKNWGGYLMTNGGPACVLPDPQDCLEPENYSNGTLTMFLLHFGGWSQAMTSIQPLMDFLYSHNLTISNISVPIGLPIFTNHSSFWSYSQGTTDTVGINVRVYNRMIRGQDFSESFSDLLTTKMRGKPMGCTATHTGGRAAEISSRTSSVSPHFRNATWSLSCGTLWETPNDKEETFSDTKGWKDELYTYGKGVYYNEPDYHQENWQEEFWGGNYARLQQIKQIWDPENFFSCHHCVRVDNPVEPTPPPCPTGAANLINSNIMSMLALLSFYMFL